MNRLVFRHGAWVALLLAASAALAQPAAVAERYSSSGVLERNRGCLDDDFINHVMAPSLGSML